MIFFISPLLVQDFLDVVEKTVSKSQKIYTKNKMYENQCEKVIYELDWSLWGLSREKGIHIWGYRVHPKRWIFLSEKKGNRKRWIFLNEKREIENAG